MSTLGRSVEWIQRIEAIVAEVGAAGDGGPIDCPANGDDLQPASARDVVLDPDVGVERGCRRKARRERERRQVGRSAGRGALIGAVVPAGLRVGVVGLLQSDRQELTRRAAHVVHGPAARKQTVGQPVGHSGRAADDEVGDVAADRRCPVVVDDIAGEVHGERRLDDVLEPLGEAALADPRCG